MCTTCYFILNQIDLCCVEESALKRCPLVAKMPSVRSLSSLVWPSFDTDMIQLIVSVVESPNFYIRLAEDGERLSFL